MGLPSRGESRNLVFTVKMMRWCGMWPVAGDGWGYRCYSGLMSLNYLCLMILLASVAFSRDADAHSLLQNACNIFSLAPRCAAIASVLCRRRQYSEVVDGIQGSACSIHDDLYDDDELPFRGARSFERTVSKYYITLQITCGLGYLLLPLKIGPSGPEMSRLPVNTYPLLDRTDPMMFALEYSLQALIVAAMVAVTGAVDMFVFFSIKYCAHQFQALAAFLRAAARRGHRQLDNAAGERGSHSGDPRPPSSTPTPGEKMADATLNSLIKYHQSILENGKKLSELLSSLLLVDYVTDSIAICLLLYQMTQTDNETERMTMVVHLCSSSLRLFIICYWCSELTNQSLLVAEAVYGIPWHEYGLSNERSLGIMLCRSQAPVLLKAGPYAVMSLELYSAVIQGAYTYFNLIQQLST